MKIVVNRCYGGFGLSKEAYEFLGLEWDGYGFKYSSDEQRTDPNLIRCVETLGKKANGWLANLEVVDIPDDVDYEIENYDGVESIHEVHRVW